MTKNMTRKGLALGASATLIVAGLTSVPAANAAETLSLAPTAGTVYAALTTSSFELEAGFAGTESTAAASTLKYRITNPSLTSLAVGVTEGGDTTETGFAYGTTTPAITPATATAADFVVLTDSGDPAIGATQQVSIEPNAHTANVVVTVQAWLDLNGNNVIDGNEATSPVRTITFYDQANVSFGSAVISDLTLGLQTMNVAVTTSPALNYRQLDAGDIRVQAIRAGVDDGSVENAAWNTAKADYRAAITDLTAVTAGVVYGAQVEIFNGTTHVDLGDPVYASVGSGKISALSAVDQVAGTSSTSADAVRVGSGSMVLRSTATIGATDSKAQQVTFVISENSVNSLAAGASITAGGKTLTNTSAATTQSIEVTVTTTELTETTARAELALSYTGLVLSNAFSVSVKAEGSGSIVTGAADVFTAATSTATALVDNVTDHLRVVKGENLSIGYTLVDQFGQAPVGNFRVVISENGSTPVFSGIVPLTNGTGTFSITENSTANSNYVVTATLQKQATNGTWAAEGSITEETNVSAVSAAAAATVTGVATDNANGNSADADGSATPIALSLFATASGDSEVAQDSVSWSSYAGTKINGVVSSASGAPLAGALVTLSAPGLQFVVDKNGGGKHYAADSITVSANASGEYVVLVSSHKAGKQTVTITSGAATVTEDITFAAADAGTATAWSLSGTPASAAPGSTFKATAKLTDKWGNPVRVIATDTEKILVSYTGPGIVFGTLPSTTGVDGTLSFSVLLGANDTGNAVVTVGYSLDDDGNTSDYGEFAASASITVGAAGVTTEPVATWTKNQNDGTIKVYAKNIVGAGKVQFMFNGEEIAWVRAANSADPKLRTANGFYYLVRTVELVEGQKNVFEIYLDGVRQTRTAYTY